MRLWFTILGMFAVVAIILVAFNIFVLPVVNEVFPGLDAFSKSHVDFGWSLVAMWLVYVWQKEVHKEELVRVEDELKAMHSKLDELELLVRG